MGSSLVRSFAITAAVGIGMVAVACSLPAAAAAAGVERSEPFTLDKWYDLNVTEGPVTLHRIRAVRQTGGITKSMFVRPGNEEYLDTIQFQLEYSNDSTADWEAHVDLALLDAEGVAIDGYNGDEGLGEKESHEETTITISTLKYGMARAKTMRLKITCERD